GILTLIESSPYDVMTFRGEASSGGHCDESLGTDNETCTVTTVPSAAPSSGPDGTGETFTVEDALEVIGFGAFQWKMSLLTGLSWIGDAMEMMILSILGPQLHCEWRLPSYKMALLTSCVFFGMGISSPLWGNLSDKYGRRVSLTICMCWTLHYGLLSAFAPAYGWLLVLRALVGFGLGGTPQSVTFYSEFLPAKARGISIMLIAVLFWAVGTVFEVLLALWVMPTLGWRWLLGLSTLPMAIFVCFCLWLPESPRFDVLSGKRERAVGTLTSIAKQNGTAMPAGKMIAYKQNDRGRIKDLFTPQYRKTTLLLWFIWLVKGTSFYFLLDQSILFIRVWTTNRAKQATTSCSLECKYLTSADYKDLLWTSLAEFPGLIVTLLAVECIGRKKSMALCFFMFSLFCLCAAFIAGGYQVVFLYTPEVFPTETRAIAMGTSSAMSRLGALITPFVAQVMLRTSMYLTLSVYCGCSVLAGFASLLLPIETLGRGLQESGHDEEARGQASATASHTRRT
uniref:SV2 related protein b n=1 Tax=Scophthalmus maximus TaxID=52904 RepID=A0A8D3BXK8_SCOMX